MKLKIARDWHLDQGKEGMLFLAQVLDELFFDYTLDTYKPPALNAVYLIIEAIDLINDIEDEIIDEANLQHVLEELEWSLTLDPVVKLIVKTPLDKFILKGETIRLNDIRIRLEVLFHSINPLKYIEVCQQELKKAVVNLEKKKIKAISRTYASSLINHRVNKQHLYEKTREFFFRGKQNLQFDDLDIYFQLTSPTQHDFEVYFIVNNLVRSFSESLKAFDLKIIDSPPKDTLDIANENNLIPNTMSEVWVEVEKIQACDRHSARREAESRLEMVRDTVILFSHKNHICWREQTLIAQCCEPNPVVISAPINTMEKCFDLRVNNAANKLEQLLSKINLSRKSLTKFHQAVDLHGVAATNDKPENQLLNVWIALETIVPSFVDGNGKVTKICNGILPILLKNYVKRIVQNVAGDLVRWSRQKTSKRLRKITTPNNTLYERTICLLCDSSYETLRSEIYSELDNFPLLKNRVFDVSGMFSSPGKLIERLELHKKKIAWQLRRIYRTRNLIVHSGRSPDYLDTLIENAHDYLDQVMSAIVEYSCGEKQASSLEQVFDFSKLEYEVFFKQIKDAKKFDAANIGLLL